MRHTFEKVAIRFDEGAAAVRIKRSKTNAIQTRNNHD